MRSFRASLLAVLLMPLAFSPAAAEPVFQEPVSEEPVFEDFVGSDACRQCHPQQVRLWEQSTHAHAGGVPGPDVVISDFDGTVLRFKDATVTLSIRSDGEYLFDVSTQGSAARSQQFKTAAVVGGGHMAGGGTQTFFYQHDDGTLRMLPFDFSRQHDRWFCQAKSGWRWISQALPIGSCLDWPPYRRLDRSRDCAPCHASQLEARFDPEEKIYRTRYKSLGINCESCHGPGRDHLSRMTAEFADSANAASDIAMMPLAVLEKDESLSICLQCHAQKREIRSGYLNGSPERELQRHFILKDAAMLNSLHPDGKVRGFGYQKNHLFSDCYLNGSMTCTDCHDPHSQSYRDLSGTPLPGRFDNGQCTQCHPSKQRNPAEHSHHEPGSPGDRCTSCHMPYLQHGVVGPDVSYRRADHTVSIPRPSLDERRGIESACQQCHLNESPAWSQEAISRWYGETKPLPDVVQAMSAPPRGVDLLSAKRSLLDGPESHGPPLTRALALFTQRYLFPAFFRSEALVVEPEVFARLKELSHHQDSDLRVMANVALHLVNGDAPDTRALLAKNLRQDELGEALTRDRWAGALRLMASEFSQRRDWKNALRCYDKALEIKPSDATAYSGMSIVHFRQGNTQKARSAILKALQIDPVLPSAVLNWDVISNQH